MNISELKEKLQSLNDESRLQFMMEGKRVMNRFDHNGKKVDSSTVEEKASFILYSLIGSLIIFKAQGKDSGKAGKEILSDYFSSILKRAPKDIQSDLSSEIMKAESLIQNFLLSSENIALPALLSSLAPMVFVKLALSADDIDKKIFHSLSKSKETIFNLSALYIRSLFRAVLTLDDVDPNDIVVDVKNIESGIIRCRNNLIIPTGMNAFTMDSMKMVMLNDMDKISDYFSLNEVSKISCLYLTKQILVLLPL